MSNFERMVESRVLWLARFKPMMALFRWIARDPQRNESRFIVVVNSANTLVYLTAAISPWIFLLWVSVVPWLLFRTTPIGATAFIIRQVRDRKMSLGSFVLTVFFLMIHYICIFACLYMIVGVVVGPTGEPITGIWEHFFFSTVTFTTLGYGNLVPANFGAELVATIEALVGFSAFAFLIGIASAAAMQRYGSDDT